MHTEKRLKKASPNEIEIKKILFISWPFGKQTATAASIGNYRKAKQTANRQKS